MFTQIKIWLYTIITSLGALFVGIFIYRGRKIEGQQNTIDEQKQAADVAKKYYSNKIKIQEFEKQNSVASEKAKHVDKVNNIDDGSYTL